jgi:hypothetical protein
LASFEAHIGKILTSYLPASNQITPLLWSRWIDSALARSVLRSLAVGAFTSSAWLQWNGGQSIAFADSVSYVVSGTNLIRFGQYLNPFGQPELWFPPFYPVLIGSLSFGGYFDPFLVARLISFFSAVSTILLISLIPSRVQDKSCAVIYAVAAVFLALNPSFQLLGTSALSQALATMLSSLGFCIWIRLRRQSGWICYGLLGLVLGLATLTRPEALVLLPLWGAIDYFYSRNKIVVATKYGTAIIILFVIVTPYSLYIMKYTGKLSITNKGEVNLAAGRSAYYGLPREYIDPGTLRMGYYNYPTNDYSEAKRVLWNVSQIIDEYVSIFHRVFVLGVFGIGVLGIAFLYVSDRRLLCGLITMGAYLPILAFYAVGESYLHTTIPMISIFTGFGVFKAVQLFSQRDFRFQKATFAALLGLFSLGLVEQGSRYSRWVMSEETPKSSILRDAGRQFASRSFPTGVMYEDGATVGYYARQRRGRLTTNDFATMNKFMRGHSGEPVYLAVSSFGTYHQTVQRLLVREDSPYPVVLELADSRGRVVIYRVE